MVKSFYLLPIIGIAVLGLMVFVLIFARRGD